MDTFEFALMMVEYEWDIFQTELDNEFGYELDGGSIC